MAEFELPDQGSVMPSVRACWIAHPHPAAQPMLPVKFQRDSAAQWLGRR